MLIHIHYRNEYEYNFLSHFHYIICIKVSFCNWKCEGKNRINQRKGVCVFPSCLKIRYLLDRNINEMHVMKKGSMISEGSPACLTHCDMGHPFILVIFCCRTFGSGAVSTIFLRLRSVAAGIRSPSLPLARPML